MNVPSTRASDRRARERRSRTIFVARLIAFGLLGTATGCALGSESTPRTIPETDRRALVDVAAVSSQDTGVGRIYLERTDTAGALTAVARDLEPSPGAVMNALLAGPTEEERARGLRSPLPLQLSLNDARYIGNDIVKVDVTSQIFEATGDDLVSVVAQIVLSLCEISGVERVVILVDGDELEWPRGDGTLTTEPLTVFDYPGRAVSTQPDYPGIVEID